MSVYPTAIDTPTTLGDAVNKTTATPLQTTLTANALAADTTLQVADAIGPGFPATGGIIRIGDETILYTGRTATTFTGCQRGALGTAAAHSSGTVVRALNDALFYRLLRTAVISMQNTIGTTGAYNFALVSHTHAANDIVSGTIAVARLPVMGGASAGAAGTAGAVPAPSAGDQGKYLRGDGTWQTVSAGSSAASGITFTPAGTVSAVNVQAAIEELDAEKVPITRTITTGAGLAGGGDLGGNLTLTADVRTVHGRTGNVSAAAGDYNATQVDASGSGWMSGATAQQLFDAIKSRVDYVEGLLANYLTTAAAAATYVTQTEFDAHSHNLNVFADGGHNHFGTVTAEPDHTHNGNTSTPV